MKILVPVKRVSDPDNANKVKVAGDGKSVTTEGLEWKPNPFDEYAVETALRRLAPNQWLTLQSYVFVTGDRKGRWRCNARHWQDHWTDDAERYCWNDYRRTGAVSGIDLPDGLRHSDRLPAPIFTPSTKAELGTHDENISFDEMIDRLRDRSDPRTYPLRDDRRPGLYSPP